MKFLLRATYFATVAMYLLQIGFNGVDGVPLNFENSSATEDQEMSDIQKRLNGGDDNPIPNFDEEMRAIQNIQNTDRQKIDKPEFEPESSSGYSYHHSLIIIPVGLIIFLFRLCARAGCKKDNNSDREQIVT